MSALERVIMTLISCRVMLGAVISFLAMLEALKVFRLCLVKSGRAFLEVGGVLGVEVTVNGNGAEGDEK